MKHHEEEKPKLWWEQYCCPFECINEHGRPWWIADPKKYERWINACKRQIERGREK